ncbi:MAG TPA: hypothetical protein VFS70_13960 [Actinomycetota bacterium]|nr:hypothetical protein [Actinomycetota bacterium]
MVVGAGPAGAAAALEARRLRPDASVLLVDKAAFPRDKACGDGLGPHAVDELAALGAAFVVFFFVVKPINRLMEMSRRRESPDPSTRKCPECVSEIPIDARRCAFCTSEVAPV